MIQTERSEFARALIGVAEINGRNLSAVAIDLYWHVLKRYPVVDVITALQRHMADPDVGQFMPKPADVIRNLDGAGDTQSLLAWSSAIKAASTLGTYQSVVFDDWRIHAVITDMGGWIDFGQIDKDELPFKAREFEKRYRGYLRLPGAPYPRKLTGRFEAQNTRTGSSVEPPILIGDAEQAQIVFDGGADEVRQIITVQKALPQPKVQAA